MNFLVERFIYHGTLTAVVVFDGVGGGKSIVVLIDRTRVKLDGCLERTECFMFWL